MTSTEGEPSAVTLRRLLGAIAAHWDRSEGTGAEVEAQNLLRRTSKTVLKPLIPDKYGVEGSGGRGGAADVPYIFVYDPAETRSAQRGMYIVYLFRKDMSAVYLSLNQGATELRTEHGGATARRMLADQAARIRKATLDRLADCLPTIDLGSTAQLPGDYEAGNIAAIRYDTADLPSEEQLLQDLKDFLEYYDRALEVRGPRTEVSVESVDDALAPSSDDLNALVAETHWKKKRLTDVIEAIQRKRQIILSGPPGTGKTWVAKRIAHYLTGGRSDAVKIVQFHPTYSYEDFVEGLRPKVTDGVVVFNVVPGKLVLAAEQVEKTGHPVVLVIDEINRANIPSVFGELLYLLEYRGDDDKIELLHHPEFSLPSNLYIIGTMNTADRSIRKLDVALRRRFEIFDCPPDPGIIDAYYADANHVKKIAGLSEGMATLNEKLTKELGSHHTIGHSFFMEAAFGKSELRRNWDRQIRPLIGEYFFDQPDVADQYTLKEFWPSEDWSSED